MIKDFYLFGYYFNNPEFALLFILLPILVWYYFKYTQKKRTSLKFSNLLFAVQTKKSWKQKLFYLPFLLRLIILILLVIILLRPQKLLKNTSNYNESLDIMIVLDISLSMKGEDLQPNRLQIAKENIKSFIKKRNFDRIGLVVFGKEAFLQCPLTFDHGLLEEFLDNIDFLKNISEETAIGSAISSAILGLKNSQAKSKIIIMVTDGDNNAGNIPPITAAEIAKNFNIKIYSIGIGKPGQSIVYRTENDPIFGKIKIPYTTILNEKDLITISQISGGKYYNVQNLNNFKETYEEIDSLEKTKIKTNKYNQLEDSYFFILNGALILLLLEIILKETILRKLPE